MNLFIIQSEGLAFKCGFIYLKNILKNIYTNKQIIIDLNRIFKPNLIIRSHFFYEESEINIDNIPYICWSGEPFRVKLKKYLPICELNAYIPHKCLTDSYSMVLYADPGMISNKSPSIWGNVLYYICYNIKSFWIPFITFTDYDIYNIKKYNVYDKKLNCILITSNPTQKIRLKLFEELKKVDTNNSIRSLGKCLNTENNQIIEWGSDLTEIYKHFKFVLAIENSYNEGYITEKIILPFISGSIPIYYGTDKIKEIFNEKSFFYVNDYLKKGFLLEDIAHEIMLLCNDDNENTGWKKYMKEPILNNNIHEILKVKENNSIIAYEISNYINNNFI